jgi:hypothetical protein
VPIHPRLQGGAFSAPAGKTLSQTFMDLFSVQSLISQDFFPEPFKGFTLYRFRENLQQKKKARQ